MALPLASATPDATAVADPGTLPVHGVARDAGGYALAAHRIKRCTFRRLTQVPVDGTRVYDASCLYPDRRRPIPLGDLETATPICNACTADHIFRADED
jgi:hypothetical protein